MYNATVCRGILSDFIARRQCPPLYIVQLLSLIMFVHWFVLLDRMQRGFRKGKRFSFVFNSLQMLTQDLLKYCNKVKAQSAE